jgi:uncharacterized protein YbjT (DUF2867 family)
MAPRKTIAVIGATGAQGGGLVRAILKQGAGEFAARAVTRNPNSDKARELARLGAEVVPGDVDDPASLRRAFTGAHGAFCVTFFWHHLSADKEIAEARSMAETAQATGVRHVIWSTLEDTRRWIPLGDNRMPTLQGKYKVPHYDGKGEANHFFIDLRLPVTLLHTSFYWENFIHFGAGPKPGPGGVQTLTFPMGDKRLPSIASEDIGKCALGVFKARDEFVGQSIGIAGEHLTGAQMAQKMSRALGIDVQYQDVPPEVYRGFGFPGADDMGNMFHFKRDFNDEYVGARSIDLSRRLNPELQDFDTWLAANARRIPIEAVKAKESGAGGR